jgi:hypothetical protein
LEGHKLKRRGEVKIAFILFAVGLALIVGGVAVGLLGGFNIIPNISNPHPPPSGLTLLEMEVPVDLGLVLLGVGIIFLFSDNLRGLFRLAKDYITEETSQGEPEPQSDGS